MYRVILILALLSMTILPAIAQVPKPVDLAETRAAAVKYADSNSTVEVKMLSGNKVKGKIASVGADTFNLLPGKGPSSVILLDEVAQIKKKGGIGTGVWIGIAAAAGAAITLLVLKDALFCDGGAAC